MERFGMAALQDRQETRPVTWPILLALAVLSTACSQAETLSTVDSADSSPTVDSVEPALSDTAEVQGEESIEIQPTSTTTTTTTTTSTVAEGGTPDESLEDIVRIKAIWMALM